jgi:hypothetical protein
MRRPAFDALDRDWAELVRSPAAREVLELNRAGFGGGSGGYGP